MLKRLSQLPTAGIFALAFAIWASGLILISSLPILQNAGYMAFVLWEMLSPTLITAFLYVRSVRHEPSASRKIRLHVSWTAALTAVIYLGAHTLMPGEGGSDLARGLRWDLYQFAALFFGSIAFWICYEIAALFIRNGNGSEQARCSEPGDDALVDNQRSSAPGR